MRADSALPRFFSTSCFSKRIALESEGNLYTVCFPNHVDRSRLLAAHERPTPNRIAARHSGKISQSVESIQIIAKLQIVTNYLLNGFPYECIIVLHQRFVPSPDLPLMALL